jgi:hypothetical protein
VIAVYQGVSDKIMGKDYQRIYYNVRASGTWGTPAIVFGTTSTDDHYGNATCVLDPSTDDIHVFGQRDTRANDWPATGWEDIIGCTIDSADNISTLVSSAQGTGTKWLEIAGCFAWSDSGTKRIYSYGGSSNNLLLHAWLVDGGNDITSVTSRPETLSPTIAQDTSLTTASVLGMDVDTATGDLHLVYESSTDGDLYYSTSTDDGASWSTPTEEVDAITVRNHIYANVYDRSGVKFAYIYVNTSDAYYYNEVDLGGGTQTPKTLTYTGAGTAAIALQIGVNRSVSGVGTLVESRVTDRFRTHAYSGVGTSGVAKEVQKTLAHSAVGTAALVASKLLFKTLTHAATGTGTLLKRIDKNLAITATGSAALTILRTFARTLTYAATGTATLLKQVGVNRAFSGVGTAATNASKVILRSLTFTALGTANLVKQVELGAKTFTATGTANLSRLVSYLRTFTYSGTGVGGVLKEVQKTLAHSAVGTAALAAGRQFQRAFTPSGVGTSVLTAGLVKLVSLSYTGTGTSVLTRVTDHVRTFAYSALGTLGIAKQIQLTPKAITGLGTSAIIKQVQINKALSGVGTLSATEQATLARSLTHVGIGTLVSTEQFQAGSPGDPTTLRKMIRGLFGTVNRWF